MRRNIIVKILTLVAVALVTFPCFAQDKNSGRKFISRGIAFYNLENLFDTINSNVKYDL